MCAVFDIGDERLLQRFLEGGFTVLKNDEPLTLGTYLDAKSRSNGHAWCGFLAQAIRSVYAFFKDHDESGGVRIDFIKQLDQIVISSLGSIQDGDPIWAAAVAMDFRDEMARKIQRYSVLNRYG